MTSKNQFNFLAFLILFAVVMLWGPLGVGSQSIEVASIPTSFSYQGQLKEGGVAVNGNYDIRFRLHDAASGGAQIGNTQLKENEPVTSGIFTVELDFGAAAFQGDERWLEVSVKPSSGGDFTILEPRQKLAPTPYAMTAYSVADQELLERIETLEQLLANVTREEVNGYDTLRFSEMNVQVVNGTGTTGGVPDGLGNLIVGYNELRVDDNARNGSHYVIVGKENNYSSYGGIVAGIDNTASGGYASVTGGSGNTASGHYTSVTGGGLNTASGLYASVTGGHNNTASGGWYASVTGGSGNTASGHYASVTGGYENTVSYTFASVTGGRENTANGMYTSVSGGNRNVASGNYSSILGGYEIIIDDAYGIHPELP